MINPVKKQPHRPTVNAVKRVPGVSDGIAFCGKGESEGMLR